MRNLLILLPFLSVPAFSASICDDPFIEPKPARCVSHTTAATAVETGNAKPVLAKGLQIKGDVSGTIYQKLDLQKDDVITQINGRSLIEIMADGSDFLKQFDNQGSLEMKIYRPDSNGGQTLDYIADSESQKIGWKNNPKDLVSGRKMDGDEGKALVDGILIGIVHYVLDGFKVEKDSEGKPIRVIEVPDAPVRPAREPKDPNPEAPVQPESPTQPQTPIDEPETSPQEDPENPNNGDDDDNDDNGNNDDGGAPTPDNGDDFLPTDPDESGNTDDTGHKKPKRAKEVFQMVEEVRANRWIDPNKNPDNFKTPKLFDDVSSGTGKSDFKNRLEPLINPGRTDLRLKGRL